MARTKKETETKTDITAVAVGAEDGNAGTAPAAEKQNTDVKTMPKKRVYLGASLPGYKTSTVFEGEKIPKVLDVPFVRELCVDVEKAGEFYKKKAVTDSREAFCYRKSAEYAKEIGGKNNG